MRVLFSPHEICGQMQLLAEAFRAQGHDAKAITYQTAGGSAHGYQNDLSLELEKHSSKIVKSAKMLRCFMQVASKYDVFHFIYGKSLLPGYWDLPILKRMGKKIFVHFRGSDIRQRKYLFNVIEQRIQGKEVTNLVEASSSLQKKRIKVWKQYADAIFVSIPELVEIVPEAMVVQQAINLSNWEHIQTEQPLPDEEIIIAHAPSDRHYKGTQYLIDAVDKLCKEGYRLKLDVIENRPHNEVRERYARCHIGVDELLQGSYGNVSIELMAMGKPVVAYLIPWYQQHRPELPILNASPADIDSVLKTLLDNQKLRQKLGHQGREYVERWHSVSRMVDRLIKIYTQ